MKQAETEMSELQFTSFLYFLSTILFTLIFLYLFFHKFFLFDFLPFPKKANCETMKGIEG